MSFVDTLVKRAANRPSGSGGSYSVIGLYYSEKKEFSVILCPDAKENEGQTFPIEASVINQNSAAEYAKIRNSADVKTAIDYMDSACRMAKGSDLGNTPPMLFMLPSVNFFNGKISVHRNGYGCRTPLLEGAENNIRYPVGGYLPVEACVFNVLLGQRSKRGLAYDAVNYFVNMRGAKVYEGKLGDMNFAGALASEISRLPFIDKIVGGKAGEFREKGNAFFDHASANEAVKYVICPDGHPDVVLFGSIVSLYQKNWKTSPEEIMAAIRRDIARRVFNGEEDCEGMRLLSEKTILRCVTGLVVHEFLSDMRVKSPDWPNRRVIAPLVDRCCQLSRKGDKFFCLPPGASPVIEDQTEKDGKLRESRHLLQTLRSMTLKTPVGGICFPQGYGILVFQIRRDSETNELRYVPSLEGGMISRRASDITTRYQFDGVKFDLSENGIPVASLPELMKCSPDEMLAKAQGIFADLDDPESLRAIMTEDASSAPDPIDLEQAEAVSDAADKIDDPAEAEGDKIPF